VLIDTFLVRTALVPGLTLWIGPKAGWPGPLWSKQGAADEAPRAQADEPRPLAAGDKPVGDEA
jgi:uncharacterized membrane protein YdfJ with MMPL/SSD domain